MYNKRRASCRVCWNLNLTEVVKENCRRSTSGSLRAHRREKKMSQNKWKLPLAELTRENLALEALKKCHIFILYRTEAKHKFWFNQSDKQGHLRREDKHQNQGQK